MTNTDQEKKQEEQLEFYRQQLLSERQQKEQLQTDLENAISHYVKQLSGFLTILDTIVSNDTDILSDMLVPVDKVNKKISVVKQVRATIHKAIMDELQKNKAKQQQGQQQSPAQQQQ